MKRTNYLDVNGTVTRRKYLIESNVSDDSLENDILELEKDAFFIGDEEEDDIEISVYDFGVFPDYDNDYEGDDEDEYIYDDEEDEEEELLFDEEDLEDEFVENTTASMAGYNTPNAFIPNPTDDKDAEYIDPDNFKYGTPVKKTNINFIKQNYRPVNESSYKLNNISKFEIERIVDLLENFDIEYTIDPAKQIISLSENTIPSEVINILETSGLNSDNKINESRSEPSMKEIVNINIREINSMLSEIEKKIKNNLKLRKENNITNKDLWKPTLGKFRQMNEKAVKIANMLKEMGA
jgi:hypothetical protein